VVYKITQMQALNVFRLTTLLGLASKTSFPKLLKEMLKS